MDVLRQAAPGATFLLNAPHGADTVWDHLPRSVQQTIIDKRLRFFVVDATAAAREAGLRAAPTRSCRPVSLRCRACCRATRPSAGSRRASKRPMPARAAGGGTEFRRGRWRACPPAGGRGARHRHRDRGPAAHRAGRRPRFRARGDGQDDGRAGRHDPGQRDAGRWHLPVGHRGLGKAQHRRRGAGLARGSVHPVWPVQLCLPAQRDPREIL